MAEMEEKIARLPVWARDHIHQLETCRQPLLADAARARREAQVAKDREQVWKYRCEAMLELISFAALGGHPDAAEYVRFIFAEFGPELAHDEES